MTDPVYYTTESGWESQENAQWTQMMNTMATLPNAQAQLHYFFSTMIEFLVQYLEGKQSWSGYDMNASSGLETDLSNIMYQVNLCENGDGPLSSVNSAVTSMNDYLLQVYTDPALEGDQMQTDALNSFQELLGNNCTVVYEPTDVYYDGSSQATVVDVPQLSLTPDQGEDVLNEWDGAAYSVPGTSSEPEGGGYPAINPTDEGYQTYLSEQSQWMTDLTTDDDDCGEVDQVAQAEFSMYQGNEKMMLGTWSQANSNFVKNEEYWLQQMGNS